MANSKFEYIRLFETPDSILPDTWIVIRIDGRGFHKLSAKYEWQKPNDERAINLMNEAAKAVMQEVQDLVVAYGQSDEYSFVFPPSTQLFDRRASKLTSTLLSTFTSYYTHLWPTFFSSTPLSSPLPTFDARHIVYPTTKHIRDYLSWRQADCHINNLYNTTFWTLVQKEGMGNKEAEESLKGSLSGDKNEILWRHGLNYNEVDGVWRKGSVIWRDYGAANGPKGSETEGVKQAEDARSSGVSAKVSNEETDNDLRSAADNSKDGAESDAETFAPTQESAITPSVTLPTREQPSAQPTSSIPPQVSPQPPSQTPQQPSSKAEKPFQNPASLSISTSSPKPLSKTQALKLAKRRQKATITISHVDIIKDTFWEERPWVLGGFP